MRVRAERHEAAAELPVARVDGHELLTGKAAAEAARIELEDGIRLDGRAQDLVDILLEYPVGDFWVRIRRIARDVVDMAEHIDVGAVAADVLCHELVITMKRFFFALALVIGRVVDILAVDDVLGADDEVEGLLLEEVQVALEDGLIHADLDAEALLEAAQKAQERVTRLAAGYENTAAIREGIPAVICGLPNTGKSSLYNALAGEELAIVTGEAGTTRDILSSELSCGKVLLRLSDTAGVRETAAEAESIGVCRALGAMERASLILLVFDGSRPLCAEDEALARRASAAPGVLIPVLNKSDLPALLSASDLAALCGTEPSVLSAATGAGVADLRSRIENLFLSGQENIDAEPLLCSGRQYSAALRAAEHLSAAVSALEAGLPPDCAASDLELALGDLGELDGRAVDEEIVARIFANFCVGK